jgi:metallophosphoesterase superfamily enzyme
VTPKLYLRMVNLIVVSDLHFELRRRGTILNSLSFVKRLSTLLCFGPHDKEIDS